MTRAVLLIHGFATDASDFINLMPYLEKLYNEVSNKNLPGHGLKNHLKEFKTEETFLFVMKEFDVLKKKYDSVDIIGFSLGGALAAYIASHQEVKKLVLLAPSNEYFNLQSMTSRVRYFLDYLLAHFSHHNDVLSKQKELLINDRKAVHLLVKQLMPNYNLRSFKTFKKIIKCCNEGLDIINSKTLLIWGDCDQLVPYSSIEYVSRYCQDFSIKIIPRMSHLILNATGHRKVINLIVDFLK